MKTSLRIASWNVNGLRSCARKGFLRWLEDSGCDVVGIQELRAFAEQLSPELRVPPGWQTLFHPAQRPGYSGVALFCRQAPDEQGQGVGDARFDIEGRFHWARWGQLVVANIYFPKGSGTNRDNSRVPFKLDFYRAAFERLDAFRRSNRRVLAMGDFNTAHQDIDLARPKQNQETSGFLPEERAELQRWVEAGWCDSFRHFERGPGHYSWWSQRLSARERNIGWRIDYVLASRPAMKFVTDAFIWPDVMGSDHCPVGLTIDARVLTR